MPAHRRLTEVGEAAFLAALARGESVRVAAVAAGCSCQALYRRRIVDQVFARCWREAEALALQSLCDAMPRKRPGFTRPVFAGRGKRMSDGMVLARLKAILPERYCEPAVRAK